MPHHTVYLGAAPPAEPRVQPGYPDFREKHLAECAAYVVAVKRFCGEPPAGAALHAKRGNYDFGEAWEVAIDFDTDDEVACRYAQYCEEMGPQTWADAGMEPPLQMRGRGR
jgi:hypothetical protein